MTCALGIPKTSSSRLISGNSPSSPQRRSLVMPSISKIVLQVLVVFRKPHEHAREIPIVFRRDQAMGVVAPNQAYGRQNNRFAHIPPRLASSNRRTICIAGIPPRTMNSSGVCP